MNLKYIVALLAVVLYTAAHAQITGCEGQTTTVTWTVPQWQSDGKPLLLSDITAYKIYYSQDPTKIDKSIQVGPSTQKSISGLPCGTTYFQMATLAVDGAGIAESTRTGIASKTLSLAVPTPPPAGNYLVCACTANVFGDCTGYFGGCGGQSDRAWVVPTNTTRVCSDSLADHKWPLFSALQSTDTVAAALGKTIGPAGADECRRDSKMIAKSVVLAAPTTVSSELCLVAGIAGGIRPVYGLSADGIKRGIKIGDLAVGPVSQPVGTLSPIRVPECSCTDFKNLAGITYARISANGVSGYVAGCKSYGVR